ncbi:MAG: lytic transglycosylase domain-containing protein [Clostridiales bacterium]|nr:lytic transglycosylase domain-containing protein [Clostridiales bacterium]
MKIIKRALLFAAACTVLFFAVRWGYGELLDRFLPLKYEDSVVKYSEENGLDSYFVMAVIRAESGFDHEAHSGLARGLMQITDDTAKWIAVQLGLEYHEDMVEDPATNIKMGCFYLAYLMDIYENRETALAAYNAGMGNVNSWLKDPRYSDDGKSLYEIPYGETKRYVERVNKFERLYKKIY